jgi:hypothetical protein
LPPRELLHRGMTPEEREEWNRSILGVEL